MTRYEQIAAAAISSRLSSTTEPVSLWSLSCTADEAARAAGKRRDLYDSLYRYAGLLPDEYCTCWLTSRGGSGDGLLMVVREGWEPGVDNSTSLLLGAGILEYLN